MIPYAATLLGLVFYSVNAKRTRRLKKLAK